MRHFYLLFVMVFAFAALQVNAQVPEAQIYLDFESEIIPAAVAANISVVDSPATILHDPDIASGVADYTAQIVSDDTCISAGETPRGNVLRMDINSFLEINDTYFSTISKTEWTLSFWYNWMNANSNWVGFVQLVGLDGGGNLKLDFFGAHDETQTVPGDGIYPYRVWGDAAGGNPYYTDPEGIACDSTWQHIVLGYDADATGDNWTFYLDGALLWSLEDADYDSIDFCNPDSSWTVDLIIGAKYHNHGSTPDNVPKINDNGGGKSPECMVDDLRFYESALSAAQVTAIYNAESSTSIKNNVANNQFAVYPNPANTEITLSEIADVEIYNISGQLVITKDNAQTVDISNLNQGVYLVKTENSVIKLFVE